MVRSRPLPVLVLVLIVFGWVDPADVAAQAPHVKVEVAKARPKAVAPAAAVGRKSVVRLLSNPMLWPLALCSVVAVGFALERSVALRRGRVIPRDFAHRFLERLASGKLDRDRAVELCRANESPVARVFALVMRHWGEPAAAIRQAIGPEAASEVADLKRNVRVLNATATLAPLLGLLGTVIGMIEAFDALSGGSGTDKGQALAHGISLALVTTAIGLGIAIISVTAYYYLLNRVDVVVRDLDDQALRAIDLVAGDEGRTMIDRRVGEHGRHEPRPIGRSEPV